MGTDKFPNGGGDMALRRLAKDATSTGSGRCQALYATDDPTRMVAQVRVITDADAAQLVELDADEVAGSIPTETLFRAMAKYASEHGDDGLGASIDMFLIERGM
jgi:hypothetical protein